MEVGSGSQGKKHFTYFLQTSIAEDPAAYLSLLRMSSFSMNQMGMKFCSFSQRLAYTIPCISLALWAGERREKSSHDGVPL